MKRNILNSLTIVLLVSGYGSTEAVERIYVDFDSILLAVDGGAIPGTGGIPPSDELYEYDGLQREGILFYLNDRYVQHDVVFMEGLPPVPGSASVITLNQGSGGSSDSQPQWRRRSEGEHHRRLQIPWQRPRDRSLDR